MLTGVLSLLACSPGAFRSCVIQMTAFSHLVAFQATDGVENLPPVYLFSQPLLTSSHTPRHLHTKPQSDFKKKKSKTSPQPHSKMSSVSVLRKKKAEERMTHDRANKQLSEGMLVSHGVEICLYVVERAWD